MKDMTIEAKLDLRERLTGRRKVKRPAIGATYIGVPPVGETGWVHGRKGVWQGDNRMQCPETGEVFRVNYIVH